MLGLAVLAKGPVAVVLTGLTLLLFGALRRDPAALRTSRPLPGLALTALVSLPWYGLELLVEGQPFWDSFFPGITTFSASPASSTTICSPGGSSAP